MLKAKKLMAVLTVMLLVFSVFAMLAPGAEGAAVSDEDETPSEEYGWLNEVEINGNQASTPNEPNEDVYVGENDVDMLPTFRENITDNINDEANITHSEVEVDNVQRLIGDDWTSNDTTDWEDGSDTFEWNTDTIYTDTGSFNWALTGSEEFAGSFGFDIPNEATPGIYRIPIMMQIENYSSTTNQWYGPHETSEYIWLEVSGNAEVDDRKLEPGIEFAQRGITVENIGNSDLEDVYLELTESDLDDGQNQVTIHNPDDTAYVDEITQGFPYFGTRDFNFRFTVPEQMGPGEYEVDYTFEATRTTDEETVTEHGSIIIDIIEKVEVSAELDDNEVEQGAPPKTFSVNFTNTGNINLENLKVRANPNEQYFFVPSDYYEDGTPTSDEAWAEIGNLEVSSEKTVEFVLGTDTYIPVGQHKLNFQYEGYFYEETGNVTDSGESGYVNVDNYGGSNYQYVNEERPYVFVNVTSGGETNPVAVSDVETVRTTDMGYQTIQARVTNNGYVTYTNVKLTMMTQDTPFINPQNQGQNTIEMMDDSFTLNPGPGDGRYVQFGVIVDTTFIEERIENDNPVYDIDFEMEAVNADMVEEEDMTITTEAEVRGVGPKLMLEGELSDNDIKAGEKFELTYDIRNTGDEPVRNLKATVSPPQPTQGNIIDEGTDFNDGSEAVFYEQATKSPGAYVWTVEPENQVLEPGENTTLTFKMVSSSDMQPGSIYDLQVSIEGDTATGEQTWDSGTTIRSQEAESSKPMLSDELTLILVAIILGVAFTVGMFFLKKRKTSETAEETTPTETEETEEYEETFEEEEEIEPEPEPEETEWEEETEEDEVFTEEEEEDSIEPEDREW